MKTMFGGFDALCPNTLSKPEASARVPSAAPRNNVRRVRSPPKGHLHAEHHPARVHEQRGLSEIRAEQIVGREGFLGGVVERVEQVNEEFDVSGAAERDHPRDTQIEQ